MEQSFNPYAEWLEIPDGQAPSNYYALFGLALFEDDAETIAAAADQLAWRVRGIHPGPHVETWQLLLDQIAAGRECLLSPGAKALYDSALGGQPSAPPPPPPSIFAAPPDAYASPAPLPPPVQPAAQWPPAPMAQPPAPWAPPAASPGVVMAAVPLAEVGDSAMLVSPSAGLAHLPQETAPPPPDLTRSLRKPQPTSHAFAWFARLAGLVLLGGGMTGMGYLVYTWYVQPRFLASATPRNHQAGANGRAHTSGASNGASAGRSANGQAKPAVSAAKTTASSPAPSAAASIAPKPPTTTTPSEDKKLVAAAAPVSPPKPEVAAAPVKLAAEAVAKPTQDATPKPTATSNAPSPPSAAAAAGPAQPSAPAATSAEKQAAMRKAIEELRRALSARNMPAASQQAYEVSTNAQTPAEKAEAERYQQLTDHVNRFWSALRTRVAALQPVEELEFGSTLCIVVEASTKELVVKLEGRVQRFDVMALPAPLIASLLEDAARRDPRSMLMYGAFLALDPGGNLEKAKQYWANAAKGGVNLDELPPIESLAPKPGEFAVLGNRPTLDPEKLKVAEQVLKSHLRADFGGATTPAKKLELAKRLLEVDLPASEPLETRCAPLRQAYYLAVQAGQAEIACDAVERMARVAQLDAPAAKANALSEISRKVQDHQELRALGEMALALADKAIGSGQAEGATRLIRVAADVARKSHNATLASQATEMEKRIAPKKK